MKTFLTYYLISGIIECIYMQYHSKKFISLVNFKYPYLNGIITKNTVAIVGLLCGFILFPFLIIQEISLLFKTRKLKLEKHQHSLITGIAKELNISEQEVLFVFLEFGNILLILSQEKENEGLRNNLDERGHLKEYKHWKEIAKIVKESFDIGEKNK